MIPPFDRGMFEVLALTLPETRCYNLQRIAYIRVSDGRGGRLPCLNEVMEQ